MILEMQIGSKWFLRLGLLFISIAFVFVGYYMTYLGAWVKVGLVFSGGSILMLVGEYLYRHHMRIFEKSLSAYGIWLVMGGIEILYIGGWSVHYHYNLISFDGFIFLMLLLISINIAISLYHSHPILFLQYLTTFYLLCAVVFLHHPDYSTAFPAMFLVGTAIFLALDYLQRTPDHSAITLIFSSIVLILTLGGTGDAMPFLAGGYLLLILIMSHLYRYVDTILGLGRVPELYWGSLLTTGNLHILNYLFQGGAQTPLLFSMLTVGMLVTHYLPYYTAGSRNKVYRFSTDMEFYFITTLFFLLYYMLSPDILLLPIQIAAGITVIFQNLREEEREAPPLLSTEDYLLLGPRRGTLYLLNNRTRYHLFLMLVTILAIPATVFFEGTARIAVSLTGYLSFIGVLSFVEFRRGKEDALQVLFSPVFDLKGEIERKIFDPSSVQIDRELSRHITGLSLAFLVLILILATMESPPVISVFLVYSVAVFLQNQAFSIFIKDALRVHAAEYKDGAKAFGESLKERWSYAIDSDLIFLGLILSSIFTLFGGQGYGMMPVYSLGIFILLYLLMVVDVRTTRRRVFSNFCRLPEDLPGIFREDAAFLPYLPLALLTIAGKLSIPGMQGYTPYLFFISVLAIEQIFTRNVRGLAIAHTIAVVLLGITTIRAPYSGFVFLAFSGVVFTLDRKETSQSPSYIYVFPIIILYTARLIQMAKNLSPVSGAGYPEPFPLVIEMVVAFTFLVLARRILLENPGWDTKNRASLYPALFALILLYPVAIPEYYGARLLISSGTLFLATRINAPAETSIAVLLTSHALFTVVDVPFGGMGISLSLLILMGALLAISIGLEWMKLGNHASMIVFLMSNMGILYYSADAFGIGMVTTSLWILIIVVAFISGLYLEKRYMRWAGIGLVAGLMGKILLYDVMELPVWARALLFSAFGVALLGISYLYFYYRERGTGLDSGRPPESDAGETK